MTRSFMDKLMAASERNQSLLCVGLDPDPAKFPTHFPNLAADPEAALLAWGQQLIAQTSDLVCCYKPNFAFYEQFGPAGLSALQQIIAAVPEDVPVLLDAKRGDIGSTATAYARAAFEVWGADAITINPYLGQDAIAPFLSYPGKAVFVLAYTSNPSASKIQEFGPVTGDYLFEHIIRQAQGWGGPDQVAFVVGATRPAALARFRALAPDRWVLAPGVGAQGGSLAATLAAGLNAKGSGLILPVSRGIIYANEPHQAAQTLQEQIKQARQSPTSSPPPSLSRTKIVNSLHEIGCLQFGDFTLASGQSSPLYLDLRRISSDPLLLQQVANAYAKLLRPLSYDRIAAVPYAALTLGTAVALATGKPLIYPRKEVKSYGTGRTIEGIFEAGETAVIIEDLVTSGGSVLKAAAPLTEAGLQVRDVVVLIDREQGGRETLAAQGYHLHAIFQLSEILELLHQAGRISAEQVGIVKNYLAKI